MVNVYFFEKPTIGYCKHCDKEAVYIEGKGLHCPNCKTYDVSVFEWDEESEFPE